MKILAIEKEASGASDEQFAPFLRREAERAVQNGLISFDLIPLVPYPGFERLFGPPRGNRDPA